MLLIQAFLIILFVCIKMSEAVNGNESEHFILVISLKERHLSLSCSNSFVFPSTVLTCI